MSVPDQQAPSTGAPAEVAALPPVVLVVVAHDPGDWFDETLASLAAQQYQNASVLVLDTASETEVRSRVAAVLPDAHYRRLDQNAGFGAACNEVLDAVQGAAFFVFCHDDIRPEPDAVQIMVEEAFRSNAGIVGPKLVEWDDANRLIAVGMAVDKTGYPAPYVERGELDQEQHDSVRDVFYIPGAMTLVRADLFNALEGFDPEITYHGDDLDLCWRAHVAGARIVVAPDAEAAHLEALGARRPVDDRRRLQMRHRLRAMRVSYGVWTRLRVVPQAAVLAFAEMLYSLVLGRFRQARDVASAWMWNVRHRGEVRARRKLVKQHRKVPDSDVRRLQVRGSSRLSAFLRGQIGSSEDRLATLAGRRRDVAESLRSSKARTALVAWVLVALVLVVGSRDLLFGRISAVGDFAQFGGSAFGLIEEWMSGYRSVGLGAVEPNPTMFGFVGGLGVAFFNALGLLRKVLILGMLPLGAAGIWRLGKPVGSRRSRIVALLVYAAIPLPYNALANGDWQALVLYGLGPWIVSHLAKASGVAPFGTIGGDAGPSIRSRPLVQRVIAVGVLTGLAAMVAPVALLIVPGMALAFIVGGILCGQFAGAVRVFFVGVGGALVAFVLQLPWSTTLITDDWRTIAGTSSSQGSGLDLGSILRFDTGPLGSGVVSYLFVAGAALSLLIGRDWRLAWAARAWVLAVAGFAGAWVLSEGWLPGDAPSASVLLVPAAIGLALAASMGMAAFEVDLPDYHFGWRQILSILSGAALLLAMMPTVGATLDGRWGQPRGDYNRALSFLDREDDAGGFRVLWLGDAGSLPLGAWELEIPAADELGNGSRLAFGTSEGGTPDLDDSFAGSEDGATQQLSDALTVAGEGGTGRLGALLAPMGIEYIVIVEGPAPEPFAEPTTDTSAVRAVLDAQLDLVPVTASGAVLYRNTAWGPIRAALPAGTEIPAGGEGVADRTLPELQAAPPVLTSSEGYQDFSGSLDPGTVYLAEAASDRWTLETPSGDAERTEVMGWSNAFSVDEPGGSSLRFDTPLTSKLILLGQVALWVLAIGYLLRVRVVRDERRTLPETDATRGRD